MKSKDPGPLGPMSEADEARHYWKSFAATLEELRRERRIASQPPLPDPERREPLPGQAELPLSPGEFTLTGEPKLKRRKR